LLLARGITTDLLTDLSKSSGLSVIGFSPMEGRPRSEVGVVPRVATSFPEQFSASTNACVCTFISIEQATGRQLWSERFDRPMNDLFAIQDELGPKIVRMLPAKVSEAELRRMAQRHTRNLQAYEHFQQGQAALLVRQKSGNETARQMFRRAIDLDKTFARAYSALALTYAATTAIMDSRRGRSAGACVRAGAHRERNQPGHSGNLLDTRVRPCAAARTPAGAEASGGILGALSVVCRWLYALMASVKTFAGQPAASIPLMRTAMRLNPTSGYLYFLVLGRRVFLSWKSRTGPHKPRRGVEAQSGVSGKRMSIWRLSRLRAEARHPPGGKPFRFAPSSRRFRPSAGSTTIP
jgi:hypothetical protein